jgi:uncharacterized membrane protein
MNRKELDAFVEHHGLSHAGVEAALEAADARPSALELQHFTLRLLLLAGVLSLASGIVFFVAANWDALAIFGRFALVEAAFVLAVALAVWRPPPLAFGRYALLLAFIATGALFALYGQTYQTGADTYELFLTWALLGLPFAIAGCWSVTWAAWVFVLNVAFTLFFGWRPATGWLWTLLAPFGEQPALILLVPMLVDVLLWLLAERLGRSRAAPLAPRWLGRFALACGVGFGSWAGMIALDDYPPVPASIRAIVLLALLAVLAGVSVHALRARRDLFPLAAVAASAVFLTTVALAMHLGFGEIGMTTLALALWLIASSTLCSRLLMKLVRSWRAQGIDA